MCEIKEYVNDNPWQGFRRSLKGLSTEVKLDELQNYLESRTTEDGFLGRDVEVRVDNYINALLRGGQLVHLTNGQIKVQR
jgi:hypothetical protein